MNGRSDGREQDRTSAAWAVSMKGRLPQAPASLLVQLPPDELKQYAADPRGSLAHLAAAGPSRRTFLQPAPAAVQTSDVALLAASIQERRQKEARVFMWQQRLIDGQGVGRTELKKALTQLSLPAWLQVLQERHLAHRCAYPTCRKRPKKPHLSHSKTILPLDAPRYRISLSRRTIERDERDDAGGENSFCSKTCWRRGEWVSRWVLNEGNSTRQVQREVSDEAFGSVIRDNHGLGNEVEQGGRWERVMDEEHWTEIELLEDLEERGEVDMLSDNELNENKTMSSPVAEQPSKPLSPVLSQQGDGAADAHDVLQGQPSAVAREHAKQRAESKGTAEGFLNMLDSLIIHERQPDHESAQSFLPVHIELPAERDDIVGELSTRRVGQNDGASLASLIKNSARRANSIQLDSQGDTSMSEGDETTSDGEEADGESSQRSGMHRRRLTEEDRKKRKEEDDLFAQAWQAMSEEKTKGLWEE